MNVALIAAMLIGAGALAGAWRTLGARGMRHASRIALQASAAVLLYFGLFPPDGDERFSAGTLVVLTPGAAPEQAATVGSGIATVALPGVVARRGVESVPDLGTALRRHPDTARLRVIGGGLPARDLDAARAIPIEFDASPLPNGLVDLSAPAIVRAGSRFEISGRVQGDAGGRVELIDPAGAIAARASLGEDGAFVLAAQAKAVGRFVFVLRVLGASGAQLEETARPVVVQAGDRLRVHVLAGAPDPELKYLRRWAIDAGIDLVSHIVLSDGIAMDDGGAPLTAAALAGTDLVIVDERAWNDLDAGTKGLLNDATRNGLGLLLRVAGPLPDAVAADWSALGFRARPAAVVQTVSLERTIGAPETAAALTRRALAVEADDAAPLLRANDGSTVALWRSMGRGRVAIAWLADTYRMVLAGDAGAFGSLWSRMIATVARARGDAQPDVPADVRVDQRSVLCALADGAFIEQPDGTRIALSIETRDDGRRCAAYWPAGEGWHTLVSGDQRRAFYANAVDADLALAAARAADATRALAGRGDGSDTAIAMRRIPASRWPFLAAWLAIVALLWWLERGRFRAAGP